MDINDNVVSNNSGTCNDLDSNSDDNNNNVNLP